MTSPATSALWKMRDIDSALGEDLARGTGQPPLVGQLLAARDVKTVQDATSFLQPDFGGLHDPSLLPGMALATARLGTSANLRPGEFVVALGAPAGLTNSVSMGIVSAVSRTRSEPRSSRSVW